jgi:hypothetical protein
MYFIWFLTGIIHKYSTSLGSPVDIFGVVSFVHSIKFGLPGPVALYEEFLCMRDIMERVLRDFQAGDSLKVGINGD